MANPRYKIVNASNDVFSAAVLKGSGLVQPNTRRVLELESEISDARISAYASSGIFIKKTNEAAQNEEPLPGLDEGIALARNQLMVAAGAERDDIVTTLWDEGNGKAKAKAAAQTTTGATTAAPSATPAAQGATATAAPAASAGNTSTVGS